ncbi:MAG: LPP20 family lipoprotein [Spirochaetales bacterium]|jgi:hypothetical protein|nr:LPP20 family lipoprotein [Spirochaetales bacterium]
MRNKDMDNLKNPSLKKLVPGAALTALLLLSCAGTGRGSGAPPWMTSLAAAYPEDRYLAAAGSGAGREEAQETARAVLAQMFRVNVRLDLVKEERYRDLVRPEGAYSESEVTIRQTIGVQAEEEFINLRYSDPYRDSTGRWHVAAYLERQPTAALYRSQIEKDRRIIRSLVQRAPAQPGAFLRYGCYDAAYTLEQTVRRRLAQLEIIHPPTARAVAGDFDLPSLGEARDREVRNLTYDIRLEGDSEGRLEGILRGLMTGYDLSYQAGGGLLLQGSWAAEEMDINPRFKSLRWTVNVSLLDENRVLIVQASLSARENALTLEEARAFAFREAEKRLAGELERGFSRYLSRAVSL